MSDSQTLDPKALILHALAFGKERIAATGEELIAQAMVYHMTPEGLGVAVALLTLDKDFWPQVIERLVKECNGIAYVLLTEAWMSVPQGAAQDAATHAAMRHASLADLDVPKREVLMANYSGPGGALMATVEIKEGRKTFGEEQVHEVLTGRMVGIGGVLEGEPAGSR